MKRLMIALLLMVPLQGYAQSAAQVWAARQCDGYFARGTPEHNQCMMQSLAAGMQGGGPLVSPDVYNAPAPGALPPPPSAPRDRQMDFACMQNCTRYNYSLQYCQARCSY
jgi:hypothetical protein